MKKLTLLLVLITITQLSFAQSKEVLATINKIELKGDTVKCVFDWVANNIKYDVNKLNKIESGQQSKKNSNFKSEEEYKSHLLKKVIKQKKGVCEDYSLLFHSIVKELGYESTIIEGYTKEFNGKVNRRFGHAWNAVKVKGKWRLYDPTWGAGHVENGKKFVRNYNPEWHDVESEEMIKTHMPLDPIWQLSENPMSYNDFDNGTANNKIGDKYNYETLIEEHKGKDKKVQMQDQVNRSKEMGDGIRLIEKWRRRMTKQVGLYGITSQQDLLKEASGSSREAVDFYNDYVKAKNKKFKGKRWTIEKAKQNLEKAKEEIESGLGVYKSIDVEDKKAINFLRKAIRQSEKLLKKINTELIFLEKFK